MNGFLPCSKIDLNQLLRHPVTATTVAMSTLQFATFSVTVRSRKDVDDIDDDQTDDDAVKLLTFSIPLLATW